MFAIYIFAHGPPLPRARGLASTLAVRLARSPYLTVQCHRTLRWPSWLTLESSFSPESLFSGRPYPMVTLRILRWLLLRPVESPSLPLDSLSIQLHLGTLYPTVTPPYLTVASSLSVQSPSLYLGSLLRTPGPHRILRRPSRILRWPPPILLQNHSVALGSLISPLFITVS